MATRALTMATRALTMAASGPDNGDEGGDNGDALTMAAVALTGPRCGRWLLLRLCQLLLGLRRRRREID